MQHITDDAIDAADLWGGQIPRSNLQEALENAQPLILGPELADLRERLVKADTTLRNMSANRNEETASRIEGKAEGVRLAMSYLDEIVRSL